MNKLFLTRTFHPVGQGAFYTEEYDGFRIVYDCGTSSERKHAEKCVDEFTENDDNIDILFISHFDSDHVNLIDRLKDKVKINKVYLPLLYDKEKILLLNIYRALDFETKDEHEHKNSIKLLENPNIFFGKETEIIYVRAYSPVERIDADSGSVISELSGFNQIPSGKPIELGKLSSECGWVFIPYNHESNIYNNELLDCLEKASGLSKSKIKTNPELLVFGRDISLKEIRRIYSKLEGTVNSNSLLLYSGPISCFQYILNEHPLLGGEYLYENRIGCVYTGDVDLKEIDIKSIFSEQWLSVGIFQVPHHGSKNGLTVGVLEKNKKMVCPISAGENSRYKHPHTETVEEIKAAGSSYCLITEKPESILRLRILIPNDCFRILNL